MNRKIDICLTPELLHLYDVEGSVVVVVDILRATSCMTVAFAEGIKSIVPVSCLEDCKKLQEKGYLGAAERNGVQADGFQFGNSPFSFIENDVEGKELAMTTTNGTLAINQAKDKAKEIIIGSFLNKSAVADYLLTSDENVLIICAGWKGKVNLEDTIFAGALFDMIKDHFTSENDDVLIAQHLYHVAKDDKLKFLENSSHSKRLTRLSIKKDIEFCLQEDQYSVIPVLKGDKLVKLTQSDLVQ